ncbi:Uncharacterised protein [Chlamydia trachomatis]|nr:Uncharacterised protein [Chlamydia trachomatis]
MRRRDADCRDVEGLPTSADAPGQLRLQPARGHQPPAQESRQLNRTSRIHQRQRRPSCRRRAPTDHTTASKDQGQVQQRGAYDDRSRSLQSDAKAHPRIQTRPLSVADDLLQGAETAPLPTVREPGTVPGQGVHSSLPERQQGVASLRCELHGSHHSSVLILPSTHWSA